jgi:hypothetical protein
MVPDVSTGDYKAMLCLHCARRVVSPTSKSKYSGLANHLKFRASFTDTIKLSFARIDGLIGSNLPIEAYSEVAWWSNTARNSHTKAWLDAGWEVQEVNPKEGSVIFKKVKDAPFKKAKRVKKETDKPFTPVPARLPRRKVPSKTKVSKLYARIKNLERQKAMTHGQIRGFKPSSHYQKKLYSQNQKPKTN